MFFNFKLKEIKNVEQRVCVIGGGCMSNGALRVFAQPLGSFCGKEVCLTQRFGPGPAYRPFEKKTLYSLV
jgi:hypothetical protein